MLAPPDANISPAHPTWAGLGSQRASSPWETVHSPPYLGWARFTESLQPLGDTSQDILSSGVPCGSTHLHSKG